jgi:hypothetical protein
MTQWRKTLERVLSHETTRSIRFDDLCRLLVRLRFEERRHSGSHRIFSRVGVPEIINVQPRPDGFAKPYQIRQVRNLILRYALHLNGHS